MVVDLGLYFEVVENGFVHPQPIFLNAEFYAAEIEVDAILSYPWLKENQMGVFPHHEALARDQPTFALLYSWKRGRERNTEIVGGRNLEKPFGPFWQFRGEGVHTSLQVWA